ncbi:hypothetical protein Nepgr_022941 [Nepenthes gracilis]|uniref:Uncharacterized protein n=1 Tax=Nepenthes gracilis TaxID=150966 RepID=A0AAD3T1Q2_NEPGR|nr:hypothetical protein Nepgr_022941 [Nepenthes gracilis]
MCNCCFATICLMLSHLEGPWNFGWQKLLMLVVLLFIADPARISLGSWWLNCYVKLLTDLVWQSSFGDRRIIVVFVLRSLDCSSSGCLGLVSSLLLLCKNKCSVFYGNELEVESAWFNRVLMLDGNLIGWDVCVFAPDRIMVIGLFLCAGSADRGRLHQIADRLLGRFSLLWAFSFDTCGRSHLPPETDLGCWVDVGRVLLQSADWDLASRLKYRWQSAQFLDRLLHFFG